MKKLTIFLTQILVCGLLAAPASAQFIPQATAIPGSAPEGINYQGRLEDGGFPVNATKSMIFRVYSAPVGGVLLWTSPAQAVPVALGLFSAVVPVPTTVLVGGGARYLEVQIDATLMAPRELLNSVPYALIAKSVEGNIDVSTAGLSINANSTAPQPALYISSVTGNVGIGTGAPITAFDVGGSAQFGSGTTKSTFSATGALNTAGKITAPDYTATYGINASTAVFTYVLSSSITTTGNVNVQGSVGIGTTSPATALDVNGNAQFGSGVTKSTFSTIGALTLASNAALTLSGTTGNIVGQASVTASGFFGNGSGLTNVAGTDASRVLKAGDTMTGQLTLAGSSLTVMGAVGIGAAGLSAGTLVVRSTSTTALNPVLNVQSNAGGELLRVQQDGNVGIGTTNPGNYLEVDGVGVDVSGIPVHAFINDTTAVAQDEGGVLALGGQTNTGVSTQLGAIKGGKENGTAGNSNGYLALYTKVNLASLTERMRITSAGNVGIGTSLPASKLHMSSGTVIIDGNAATALTTVGNAGIGTGGSTPADRLEVAGGSVRLTAVAGAAGSVKLFSALTVLGTDTCTTICGANTVCLGAWTSAGAASTCGTAVAANRCLCSGFGN